MLHPGRPKKKLDLAFLQLIYHDYTHMTGREVAEKYGISLSTVQRYVRTYRREAEHATTTKEDLT